MRHSGPKMNRALHIGVIDDNASDLLLAQEAIAECGPECRLSAWVSGVDALKAMNAPGSALPDVVLLDVNMPVMTGFEVLSVMKRSERLRRIPVVMLSTSSSAEDLRHAYDLYASSYMVKSHDFAEFLSDIDAFLEYWARCRTTSAVPAVRS